MESLRSLDDLDLVHTFLVVAEEGNVTRAAARLFRTQSAVSRRIQMLEDTLGVLVFERRKTGITLTSQGARLLGPARMLVQATRDLVEATHSSGPGRRRLKVACSDTVARYLLAPVLPRLFEVSPSLELELQVSNTPQTIGRVEIGDADLGFVLLPAKNRALEFHQVLTYRHMVAFPPQTKVSADTVSLEDLMNHRLVLLDRSTRSRQLIDAGLLSRGLFPRQILEVGNVSVQKAFVREGVGVGILPDYAREAGDSLIWRSILGATERRLAACVRRGSQMSEAREFLQILDVGAGMETPIEPPETKKKTRS